MKSNLLVYSFLIFNLACISEYAYAMKGFGNFASAFRMGMKGLSYGGALAFYPWMIKKSEGKYEETTTRIEPEAENFIRTILYTAYPELKNRPFEVVRSTEKSFSVTAIDNVTHLFVGQECTNEGIKKALLFEKNNLQRYSNQELRKRSEENNMTTAEFIALGELRGYVMTPHSMNIWKCIIKHEGAHILHRDDEIKRAALTMLPLAVLYGTEKILGRSSKQLISTLSPKEHIVKGIRHLASLPITIAVVFVCMLPLRYFQEYRADQEAIKRTDDIHELKTTSIMFINLPEYQKPTLAAKVHALFNIHPSHATRARYFAQAAQKLESQKTKQ